MTYRERVRRGLIESEHIVQLFDTTESLASVVSNFLYDGISSEANLVVIAKPMNWQATARQLAVRGVDVKVLEEHGRLTVLDARSTLDSFMRHGEPDGAAFEATVGSLVRRLAARPLYAYGEMVDLLAEESDFRAAHKLEELWNELATTVPFKLLCGYCSTHFGPEVTGASLREICRAHTRVSTSAADQLGSWLLAVNAARQPA